MSEREPSGTSPQNIPQKKITFRALASIWEFVRPLPDVGPAGDLLDLKIGPAGLDILQNLLFNHIDILPSHQKHQELEPFGFFYYGCGYGY